MDTSFSIIGLVFFLAFFHFFKNIIAMYRCNKLIEKINNVEVAVSKGGKFEDLTFYRNTFLRLITNARILDKPFIEQLDGITIMQSSIARAFPSYDSLYKANSMLIESQGVYWNKAKDSLNPFNWVRFILLLPSYLLAYLGLSKNSFLAKLSNVVFWIGSILMWLFAPFLESLRSELIQRLISFFSN